MINRFAHTTAPTTIVAGSSDYKSRALALIELDKAFYILVTLFKKNNKDKEKDNIIFSDRHKWMDFRDWLLVYSKQNTESDYDVRYYSFEDKEDLVDDTTDHERNNIDNIYSFVVLAMETYKYYLRETDIDPFLDSLTLKKASELTPVEKIYLVHSIKVKNEENK